MVYSLSCSCSFCHSFIADYHEVACFVTGLLLVVVVILICIWRRRRNRNSEEDQTERGTNPEKVAPSSNLTNNNHFFFKILNIFCIRELYSLNHRTDILGWHLRNFHKQYGRFRFYRQEPPRRFLKLFELKTF